MPQSKYDISTIESVAARKRYHLFLLKLFYAYQHLYN